MDYTDLADISRHNSWESYLLDKPAGRIILMTTEGATPLWDFKFQKDDTVLMGRESAGVPTEVHGRADAAIVIPMPGGGRSLNVAMSAGIAVAEALRQLRD